MNASDLILVAVMPSPRDFEIARVLGWYRIPYKKAPKTVTVDRIAFYQTAKFGAEKWAIHYTAPVFGHELVARGELLRTERHHARAAEQYFKIQIGSLERLPRPIPSVKWRRITFLYTTGERLLTATEINDLIIDGDERKLLWSALKECGIKAEAHYESGRGEVVDFTLLCELGKLGVVVGDKKVKEQDEWAYLSFPESAVREDLPGVVHAIEAAVGRMGGQATSPGD